jgi:hypothetical protein
MKRLLLILCSLGCAANLFAQGGPLTTGGTTSFSSLPQSQYILRDINDLATDQMMASLSGQTAGTAAQNLFSTRTDSGSGTYVRSTTWFGHAIDLTCESVYNDGGTPLQTITLVAPDIGIGANHYFPANGSHVRFVAADGTITTLTIGSSSQIGSTDIQVIKFTSGAPSTITPATIASPNAEGNLSGAPVLFIDQNQEAFTGDVSGFASGSIVVAQSTNSIRSTFWKTPVTGDSSHPLFAAVDGKAILLAAFQTTSSGPSLAENAAAINAAMTSLGSTYQLTVAPVASAANSSSGTSNSVMAGNGIGGLTPVTFAGDLSYSPSTHTVTNTSSGGTVGQAFFTADGGLSGLVTKGLISNVTRATTLGVSPKFTVTFGIAQLDANYDVHAMADTTTQGTGESVSPALISGSKTTTGFQIEFDNPDAGGSVDPGVCSISVEKLSQ